MLASSGGLSKLLTNELPDMRNEVLKYLDDKHFIRVCFLSRCTITANADELKKRLCDALKCKNVAKQDVKYWIHNIHYIQDEKLQIYMIAPFKEELIFREKQYNRLKTSYDFVHLWCWRQTLDQIDNINISLHPTATAFDFDLMSRLNVNKPSDLILFLLLDSNIFGSKYLDLNIYIPLIIQFLQRIGQRIAYSVQNIYTLVLMATLTVIKFYDEAHYTDVNQLLSKNLEIDLHVFNHLEVEFLFLTEFSMPGFSQSFHVCKSEEY